MKVSNMKRKGQGNVKNGNPYLAWAYTKAARFAIRLHPSVQTVAHKLARACYHMMRHQVPFDAAKAFG
jgi:transposase